jgi:hypothetical protein
MPSGPHPSAVVDELSSHSEAESLADYVRAVSLAAARARTQSFGSEAGALPEVDVAAPAREAADTPLGNVLTTLEQGARTTEERALLGTLLALGVGRELPGAPETELELASALVWLAAHTPVDPLAALDAALGDKADALWHAVARIAEEPRAAAEDFDLAESLVAAVALAASSSAQAHAAALALAERTTSPLLRTLLAGGPRADADTRLSGELSPAPHGPVATTLLAVSGILFVLGLARLIGRFALAYRRPARLSVTPRGLELTHRTEMLGRVLRDRATLVPMANLARVTREVRFARTGLYAGLLALVLGSYFGMGLFVDGLRVPGGSFPLLGLAVLVVVLGLLIDFGLSSVADSARGRCRVVVVPRKGGKLCIGELDPDRADAMLASVAARTESGLDRSAVA